MSRLLSPQRLAAIARRWEANMDCRAIVLPQRQVDIGGGETDLQYPDPATPGLTTYPCRLQSASQTDEGIAADQQRAVAFWEIQLPVRTRLTPTDRLYVTGQDAKGGSYARMIELTGPVGPRTWEAARVVHGWEILPDHPVQG